MNKKFMFLKNSIDNFVVAVAMSLTASMISGVWDYMTVLCIPFSFLISTVVGIFVPWGRISNWFAGLFKIKPNTVFADLVGGLFTNVFITAILSFSCKMLVYKADISLAGTVFLETYWIMYLVSYVVFEIIFYLSMRLVRNIIAAQEQES